MKNFIYLLLFLFLASCDGFLSTRPGVKSSISGLSPKAQKWNKMYATFEAKCMSCHASFGTSEKDFIANGLVVPGEPQSSKIITRLKENQYSEVAANMPKGSISWSKEDVSVFVDWVESMTDKLPDFVLKSQGRAILDGDNVDLGLYFLGAEVESTKSFEIINNFDSNLEIVEIGVDNQFFKIKKTIQTTLAPKEETSFSFVFSSEEMGEKTANAFVKTNQGEIKFKVSTRGSSILKSAGVKCDDKTSKKALDYIKPLLKDQYINHLINILDPKVKKGSFAKDFLSDRRMSSLIDLYPYINNEEYLKNANGGLINSHLDAIVNVSMKFAELASGDYFLGVMDTIEGSCIDLISISQMNLACLENAADYYTKISWSRLASATEKEKILSIAKEFFDASEKELALQSVISSILMHPETWMLIDEGNQKIAQDEYQRTPKGFIRMLSFTMTDTSPDLSMIEESLTKDVFSPLNLNALITHLKQRKDIDGNFLYSKRSLSLVSDYLGLDGNTGYGESGAIKNGLLKSYQEKGIDITQTMYGSFEKDNKASDQLLLKYLIEDSSGSLNDLLTSPYRVSLNPLQKFINKTSTVGTQAQKVSGMQGTGIFLNNAIFSNSTSSFYRSPPHTSNLVIKKFGCLEVGAPEEVPGLEPDDLKPPTVHPDFTVADTFDEATSQSQTCLNCHEVLNRYSNVLQGVNSLGDVVEEEVHFSQSGEELSRHYLNTYANVNLHGHFFDVENVFDLADVFNKSGSFGLCLTKEFTRFAYQSSEDENLGCEVQDNLGKFMNGFAVKDFFGEIVKGNHFRRVKFGEK